MLTQKWIEERENVEAPVTYHTNAMFLSFECENKEGREDD